MFTYGGDSYPITWALASADLRLSLNFGPRRPSIVKIRVSALFQGCFASSWSAETYPMVNFKSFKTTRRKPRFRFGLERECRFLHKSNASADSGRRPGRRPRRIVTMIEWVLTPDAGASLRSAALKPFENKGFWARHGICCVVLVCENLPVAPICALQVYPVGWFCRLEIIEIRASSGPQRHLCVLTGCWDRQKETHSSAQTL